METVEDVLAHFGVKGMKWGVRRKSNTATSDDAKAASEAASKAAKGGIKSLSNKELQTLITRMNLERQLGNLDTSPSSKKAGKFVGKLLLEVGRQEAATAIGKGLRTGTRVVVREIAKALARR